MLSVKVVVLTCLFLLATTPSNQMALCKSTDVDGPGSFLVQMTRSYVQADPKESQIQLGLLLSGYRSKDPIKATVKWSKFGHRGASFVETVEWEHGSIPSLSKNVSIPYDLSLLENAEEDFILAEIVHVTRGQVDKIRGSTIVGLVQEGELPEFAVDSETVVAAGEAAELSIRLVGGSVLGNRAALVSFAYEPLKDPRMEEYFPGIMPTSGIVSFAPGETVNSIPLTVDWDKVAPEARYHVTMRISPLFKARVTSPDPVVAVHLLGTARGACPPGSSLREPNDEKGNAMMKSLVNVQARQNSSAGDDLAIALYASDGASIPLFEEESGSSSTLGASVENRMDVVWVCVASKMKVAHQLQYKSHLSTKGLETSACPRSVGTFSRKQVSGYRVALPVGLSELRLTGEDGLAISILRQGDAQHTRLRMLKIHPSHGESFSACELIQSDDTAKLHRLKSQRYQATPECVPGKAMKVILHPQAESVRIEPELLVPNVPSVRIEMNGQVVTQHHSRMQISGLQNGQDDRQTNRESVSMEAYIMTLPAGYEIPVDIVVFGEDGTTSSKYTLLLRRESTNGNSNLPVYASTIPMLPNLTSVIEKVDGFAQCQGCAPGWYSRDVDAPSCKLCPPGTFADDNGFACIPCSKGTYSVSWGSNRCKHCIEGTVAASLRSTSCSLCPESLTTDGDGQWACDVAVGSMDMSYRYAVVIYVTVHVSGIDEDAIILKAGVDASPQRVLSNLIKTDIVKAFNTSKSAVNIMSVRRMPNNHFETNVSTSLPVYIPPSATEEDISAALEIEKLSADSPLELLEKDPDAFFGRTTEILNVHVESADVRTEDHFPETRNSGLMIGLLFTGSLCLLGGASLLLGAMTTHRRGQSTERSALLGTDFQHSTAR